MILDDFAEYVYSTPLPNDRPPKQNENCGLTYGDWQQEQAENALDRERDVGEGGVA